MSAREALMGALWDNYTRAEKNQFIDAHRDEVALEIGRDALRDGLVPTLNRLVGEASAARLLAESRSASTDDEGKAGGSARDELVNGLTEHACCFSEEDAKRMVDDHAHELAEQQRAWAREPLTDAGAEEYGSVDNILRGADRIDPKVKGTP